MGAEHVIHGNEGQAAAIKEFLLPGEMLLGVFEVCGLGAGGSELLAITDSRLMLLLRAVHLGLKIESVDTIPYSKIDTVSFGSDSLTVSWGGSDRCCGFFLTGDTARKAYELIVSHVL